VKGLLGAFRAALRRRDAKVTLAALGSLTSVGTGRVNGWDCTLTLSWEPERPWTVRVSTPDGEAVVEVEDLSKAWWEAFGQPSARVKAGVLEVEVRTEQVDAFVTEALRRSHEAEVAWAAL
jgi:hypothetical protein